MELVQQKATKMIKGDGAPRVQGVCERTRFLHPGKGWGEEGGSSCIFFHYLNCREDAYPSQKYTVKEEKTNCSEGNW